MIFDISGHKYRKTPCFAFIFLLFTAFSANSAERTLPQILRSGLANDPGILEAKANERVAESILEQSEAAFWPKVTAKGNQAVLRSSGDDNKSFQPALEAQWTVYDFGKRDAQIRRDEIKTAYFANKTDETAQEFLYELAGYYLEALKAKMQLDVAQNNLSRHQEIVRKLGIILEYDPGRRSEMTQAEARLLQVRENILNNKRLQELALARVARYVNPPVKAEELEDPFASLDIDALQARYPVDNESLKQNPSYQAQARELDSLKVELEAVELSRWPDINLLGEAKRDDSAVYLSVTFDVFDQGKTATIDEKRYQTDAASARLEKIVYNLMERAQIASLEMQENQLRIDLASNQITTLQQVALDYEDQFEIAARSLLDVLNSYNELASIEQLKVQAQYDLMKAKLDYLSAAGKIGAWAGIGEKAPQSTPKVLIAGVNDDLAAPQKNIRPVNIASDNGNTSTDPLAANRINAAHQVKTIAESSYYFDDMFVIPQK